MTNATLPTNKPLTHPQVAIAAVTFCTGLFLVRTVLGLGLFKGLRIPPFTWNDPLIQLLGISFGITLFFFALRKEEGDFRALFITTLALFAGCEVLSYVSGPLGVLSLGQLSTLLSFSVAIYSSLALSAAAYDMAEGSFSKERRALVAATLAILALSLFRSLGTVFFSGPSRESIRRSLTQKLELAGLIVLASIVAYLLFDLFRLGAKPFEPPEPPRDARL